MEYKSWLKQAKEDFEKAIILFRNRKFDGASFYAQQSAEKALKAVLIKRKGKLFKIHDLVVLGLNCGVEEDLLNKCKVLSQVYSFTRYGIVGKKIPAKMFKQGDSKKHINISKEIIEWVKKEI